MARKVMNLNQIAAAYGGDHRTFKKDMARHERLYDELCDSGFDGRKFYPIHQTIIEKYFGIIPKL